MTKKQALTSQQNSLKALSSPQYRGKHLVIIKNKIFTALTGQKAAKIFKEIIKKYPGEKPTITYVPKEGLLNANPILLLELAVQKLSMY